MPFPFDTILDLWRDVHSLFGGTGAIRVTGQNALVKVSYNFIDATYPSATQEVYVYKTGGSGGTTVATVTVNYTDASKEVLDDVTVN